MEFQEYTEIPGLLVSLPLKFEINSPLLMGHLSCLQNKYFKIFKRKKDFNNSWVNAILFYTNFINMNFQKIPIPQLTRTMKQKFLHKPRIF
jgi:hypothetical protein